MKNACGRIVDKRRFDQDFACFLRKERGAIEAFHPACVRYGPLLKRGTCCLKPFPHAPGSETKNIRNLLNCDASFHLIFRFLRDIKFPRVLFLACFEFIFQFIS